MTEQETRSLRVPGPVAARPPVSPCCTELQRDLLWLGDKQSWRSRLEREGGQSDCQALKGRWGRDRGTRRWCLNPGRFSRFMSSFRWGVWLFLLLASPETCGCVGHAGLCNSLWHFLVATTRIDWNKKPNGDNAMDHSFCCKSLSHRELRLCEGAGCCQRVARVVLQTPYGQVIFAALLYVHLWK